MAESTFQTEYDAPWKDALDFAPELFLVRWYPEIVEDIDPTEAYQSLDDQLRQMGVEEEEGVRRADRLLLFKTRSGDLLYIHIEVQCYYDKEFGRRVMSYRHRLRSRYGKPVVTIVVFGDDNRRWCPTKHTEGQHGSSDSCKWLALKLLKIARQVPDLEHEENVFSLFMTAHLTALRTTKDLTLRMEEKIRLLSNLQCRKLANIDGREWYRLIDWIMTLPEEMNRQVHEQVYRKHMEDPMKYVSFAEREGTRKGLRALMKAKFGEEGAALVDSLPEGIDQPQMIDLTTAAGMKSDLEEIRLLFHSTNGNGASTH
jgi:hypothetical protein